MRVALVYQPSCECAVCHYGDEIKSEWPETGICQYMRYVMSIAMYPMIPMECI